MRRLLWLAALLAVACKHTETDTDPDTDSDTDTDTFGDADGDGITDDMDLCDGHDWCITATGTFDEATVGTEFLPAVGETYTFTLAFDDDDEGCTPETIEEDGESTWPTEPLSWEATETSLVTFFTDWLAAPVTGTDNNRNATLWEDRLLVLHQRTTATCVEWTTTMNIDETGMAALDAGCPVLEAATYTGASVQLAHWVDCTATGRDHLEDDDATVTLVHEPIP